MPPNSSPTFTPHTPTSLVQLLVYKPCSLFLILITPSYFVQEKKNFYCLTTHVLLPLPSALPLFLLLPTPLSPPTNRAPPTHPTPPTRLTLLTPLLGITHPCPHEGHPYPSKSFLPAILTSAAALSTPPASSPFLSLLSPSDPASPTRLRLPPLPPTRHLSLLPSPSPLHRPLSFSSPYLAPTLAPPLRTPFLSRCTSGTKSSYPHY